MSFKQIKSDTLNLRVSPAFKAALKDISVRENRSMVIALEFLILEYYKQNKIPLPGIQASSRIQRNGLNDRNAHPIPNKRNRRKGMIEKEQPARPAPRNGR